MDLKLKLVIGQPLTYVDTSVFCSGGWDILGNQNTPLDLGNQVEDCKV